MGTTPFTRLGIADMLPDIEMPDTAGERLIPLRSIYGETTVIYARHAFECAACDEYVRQLSSAADEMRVWDARLLVVVPPEMAAHLPPIPFATTVVNRQLPLHGAGLIVADRYGQIFHLAAASDRHALPSVHELTEWLKHLGTLCPE